MALLCIHGAGSTTALIKWTIAPLKDTLVNPSMAESLSHAMALVTIGALLYLAQLHRHASLYTILAQTTITHTGSSFIGGCARLSKPMTPRLRCLSRHVLKRAASAVREESNSTKLAFCNVPFSCNQATPSSCIYRQAVHPALLIAAATYYVLRLARGAADLLL